jgi:hypothetical protein
MVDLPTPDGPQMTRGRIGLAGAILDDVVNMPAEKDADNVFVVNFEVTNRLPIDLTAFETMAICLSEIILLLRPGFFAFSKKSIFCVKRRTAHKEEKVDTCQSNVGSNSKLGRLPNWVKSGLEMMDAANTVSQQGRNVTPRKPYKAVFLMNLS